jgi:hypothetical protein
MDAYRFSIAWSRIFPSKPSLKPAFMLYLALIQYQANKSLWSAVAVLKSEHFLECGWFKDGLAYIISFTGYIICNCSRSCNLILIG